MPESTEDSSQVVREMAESVSATNLKVVAEGPAFYTNQAYSASNDAAAGWRSINQALVGKISESIVHTSPSEGASAGLMTALLIKNQQSTAPLTAGQLVPGQGPA